MQPAATRAALDAGGTEPAPLRASMPPYIPTWLVKPIARLDDRRPVDAIREGDYRSVSKLVAALEGMPVA